MIRKRTLLKAIGFVALMSLSGHAVAADKLKIAVGQRGYWDTAVPEMAAQSGIFQKHGIEADILYTQGGGETMQAVISDSVDIGIAAGTGGVLGAFSKGAPVRIVGSQATGSSDYWYVRTDSPLKAMTDATDKTPLAYSTFGSSSHSEALAFIAKFKLPSPAIATGGVASTFTQVMSGQLSMGFAAPPFGFNELASDKIRIIGRANDIDVIRGQSIRVQICNASLIAQHRDVLARYMDAYRETIDWMYSSDEALAVYAKFAGTTVDFARRARDEFFPKAMLDPDKISGLPSLQADAVSFKVLHEPLTEAQLAQLIHVPPRK